ncbi:DNA primase [Salipiger abyssi]|uniref:DNA primase n=1 Tax=Salipiger abyssi TaxID=1250539 RepID=UPI001A909748|nr:DNA primase [Salipiger abyssi]MBN9889119.1 DNA primase [Salipiger abyssi]
MDILPEGEPDVLAALVSEAQGISGQTAIPRLLRTAAALVEYAGYEVARSEASVRVTQIILLAAELDRLADAVETHESDAIQPRRIGG